MAGRWNMGWLALAGLLSTGAAADTLYHCKAYSGGAFWSREPCAAHQALLDRTASVPSGLTLAQQIQLAEQGLRDNRAALAPPPASAAPVPGKAALRHARHCERLRVELARQESLSRQPSSARTQERIRHRQDKLREELTLGAC